MEMPTDSDRSHHAREIFEEQLLTQRRKLDRVFSALLLVQWVAGVVAALVYSPMRGAAGQESTAGRFYLALVVGGVLALVPIVMTRLMAGSRATRHVMAASQMLFSALFIHLSGGRIETHFHIFGSLAWLAFYLDSKILVTATITVAVDHMVRGLLIPESVYGMPHGSHFRFIEHVLWVVFEDVVLFIGCRNGLRSLEEAADRHAQIAVLRERDLNKSAALEMALSELQMAAPRA